MEAYIITSPLGESVIRKRYSDNVSAYPHLANGRLDKVLIVMGIEGGDPSAIDLAQLPSMLYKRLGMKIVNHDGGRLVSITYSSSKIYHFNTILYYMYSFYFLIIYLLIFFIN